MGRSILLFFVIALLAIHTVCLAYAGRLKPLISIELIIDYGKDVREKYRIVLPKGSTLLDATLSVTEVKYKLTAAGAFIESIGNVSNDPGRSMYWMWWYWDWETYSWVLGPVAADKYELDEGKLVMWSYMKTVTWPPAKPKPIMGKLVVRAIRSEDRKPLEGVEVKVSAINGSVFTNFTDLMGWCTFQLPYGDYVITIFKEESIELEIKIDSETLYLLAKI